jgi:hypothetical protein
LGIIIVHEIETDCSSGRNFTGIEESLGQGNLPLTSTCFAAPAEQAEEPMTAQEEAALSPIKESGRICFFLAEIPRSARQRLAPCARQGAQNLCAEGALLKTSVCFDLLA